MYVYTYNHTINNTQCLTYRLASMFYSLFELVLMERAPRALCWGARGE